MAVLACAAGCFAVRPASLLADAPFEPAVHVGDIQWPEISESSGLAASRRNPGVLWTFNDSGGGPIVYAMDTGGTHLGGIRLAGAENIDWEDMAAFATDGADWLLIADVGDNRAVRPHCDLYLLWEPRLPAGEPVMADHPIRRRIRFRYEDGPRDCEAVAVDTAAGWVLLLSKRDDPPRLYGLKLSEALGTGGTPSGEASDPESLPEPDMGEPMATARFLAQIQPFPGPTLADIGANPIIAGHGAAPTAMDISPDGRRAAVLTYKQAYLFERGPGEDWAMAIQGTPRKIEMPVLAQAEGICFALDGGDIYVSTEGRPAPLLRLSPAAPPEAGAGPES